MGRMRRLFTTAPLPGSEVIGLIIGGAGFSAMLLVTPLPAGIPAWLPPILMGLGILAILRGLAGAAAWALPRHRYVDLGRYAQALIDDAATFDVARLPPLRPSFRGEAPSVEDDVLMGRVLLMGQHGSGKSRMATNTAAERLRAGRPGLFVRLSAWNTGLESLLERALSAAAGEPLDRHALEGYLARRSSFVIFDSLDEVPATSRASAGEEIGQFAQAHPWLDVTVTARYQITATELQGWRVLELAPLTREQAEQALGRPLRDLQLPSGIEALVTNPLMLGFVKADVDAGRKPESEADLLNTYVDELIVRQSRRPPKLDTTSGWRLAEEVAWAWLATGRIGLSRQEVRAMSSTVARELSVSGFLHLDAATVEHWFVECGLAAIVGDLGLPAHRTILDHLAGRSVPRHPPRPDQVRDELREAIARYVGSLAELDDLALGYLDALGTDLEFLARCAHLVQSDINWPFAPEEFANSYVAALRQLSAGPLAAVGVVPPTVRIQIDPALSWVFEEEFAGPTDIVQIVPEPPGCTSQ